MSRPILFFADDAAVERQLFQKAVQFERWDVHYMEATDGEAAYEALEVLAGQGHDGPLLVVSDLHMEPLGGLGLMELLAQHPWLRTVPRFIFSATEESQDVVAALERGASGFLRKPTTMDGWLGAVRFLRDHMERCCQVRSDGTVDGWEVRPVATRGPAADRPEEVTNGTALRRRRLQGRISGGLRTEGPPTRP